MTCENDDRVSDKGRRHRGLVRENWYRDLWLFALSALLLYTAWQTHQTAGSAKQLGVTIQRQRIDAVREGCQDQNKTNVRVTRALDAAPPRANIDKAIIKRFFDALAPFEPDCEQVVRRVAPPIATPTRGPTG